MSQDIVLDCKGISHWYGTKKILYKVDLRIIRGEFVALVGPSGCGKSTLLRAIVGTHPPCEGTITLTEAATGREWEVKGPGRDRGIVYQQYSLFPHLTAQQNVAVGLMLDSTTLPGRILARWNWWRQKKEYLERAAAWLEKLMLKDAIKLYPHEMSGGMRQRVAIAQALIMKPEILLLDEPFGALDEATREELQKMLLSLYQENCQAKKEGKPAPLTILIVTHELNEAIYVGDRVAAVSQYWNWEEQGIGPRPGATIVYDMVAPVFHPDAPRDFQLFADQRDIIRESAFESKTLQSPDIHQKFWSEIESGNGQGVLG